jgi:hypothetical protein
VNKALGSVVNASRDDGDRKGGVIYKTYWELSSLGWQRL